MLTNRPLTARTASWLTGRTPLLTSVLSQVDAGASVLVTGARGTGRTSLLAALEHELTQRRSHQTVVVQGGLANDAPGLLELVADRVVGPRSTYKTSWARTIESVSGTRVDHPTEGGRLLEAVDRLRDGLTDRDESAAPSDGRGPLWPSDSSVVVLLDDVPSTCLGRIFGQARDALWSLPLVWVVTCDQTAAAGLKHGAELFFEQVIDLVPLSRDDAIALLRARLPDTDAVPDGALGEIVDAAERTPRAVISAARAALGMGEVPSSRGAAEVLERRAQAHARAHALGRGAAMLVAVLQGQGGAASASDPELLAALGWTRARATQVLRQLEEAGLATGTESASGGAGRPRRVYRLVDELR